MASIAYPHIGLNQFFTEQWDRSGFYHDGSWSIERLLFAVRSVASVLWIPGYRKGVYLVPIDPTGWKTRIVTLTTDQTLKVRYKARVDGETPRKTQPIVEVATIDELPDAASCFVVVYADWVLAERDEPRSGAQFDIITILANPCEEQVPMNPETLMANHFALDGGTSTDMTPEQFTEALYKSVLWWSDKAMATVIPDTPHTPPMSEIMPLDEDTKRRYGCYDAFHETITRMMKARLIKGEPEERDLGLEECPECGEQNLEILTTAPKGEVIDGDPVRCRTCGQTGTISCDSETPPYIHWDEHPEPTVDNHEI